MAFGLREVAITSISFTKVNDFVDYESYEAKGHNFNGQLRNENIFSIYLIIKSCP